MPEREPDLFEAFSVAPSSYSDAERPSAGIPETWAEYLKGRLRVIAGQRAHNAISSALRAFSERAADRVEYCGSVWAEIEDTSGSEPRYSWRILRCRSRWCPYCQSVWSRDMLRRVQVVGIPPASKLILLTLTAGPRCGSPSLATRLDMMRGAWRRWRRWAVDHWGVLGGVYAFEVVPPGDGVAGFHAHLHAAILASVTAPWMVADWTAVMGSNGRLPGGASPALGWLANSWAMAVRAEGAREGGELTPWRLLLPSLDGRWPAGCWLPRGGLSAAGCVADIGGRWPTGATHCSRVLGGGDPESVLRQVVKYAVKGMSKGMSGSLDLDTLSAWRIISAFYGRRRVGTWGCWYGILDDESDSGEQDEDTLAAYRTGRYVICGRGGIGLYLLRRYVYVPDSGYRVEWSAAGGFAVVDVIDRGG